jgi:preprotein translocase subunit SecG
MNMSTLETVLMVMLVADALALAALVLMQHGKGADVGAAFGSGGANTVFGSAGSASFLTKATAWLAIGFFLIAFGLAYTAKERAAELENIGVPQVRTTGPGETREPRDVPEEPQTGAEERLTTEPEGVDSDIPDV